MTDSIFIFVSFTVQPQPAIIVTYKNTVRALNTSADAVTQNVHKSDTTTSNTLC